MGILLAPFDDPAIGRVQFDKNTSGVPNAFRRIINIIEGAGITLTDVDDPAFDRINRTIAASVAAGDTVNLIDRFISDSVFSTPGGSIPASTITIPNNASRKVLFVFAQTELEVTVSTGGQTFVEAEFELGGTDIETLGYGRHPRHSEGGVSGAPISSGTHSGFAFVEGVPAQNPGNATWGTLIRTGPAQPVESLRRVLAAVEVIG